MSEVEKWNLVEVPCQRAKCAKCGHVEYEEGTPSRAIMRLKFYGWMIVGDVAWCNECTTWSDDSEVSSK